MLSFKKYLVIPLLFVSHLSKAADQAAPDQQESAPQAVEFSLSEQEKVNQELMKAVETDNMPEAKKLIESKADVNYIDWTYSCLLSATSKAMADLLIEHKANVNLAIGNESTLHRAVEKMDSDLVEILLDNKADIDARNSDQNTPLHGACDEQTSQLLLDRKADPNAENKRKNTPMQVIANKGNGSIYGLEIIQQLIEAKAAVDHKNNKGKTALHIAFEKQNKDLARCLLTAQASMIIQDNVGVSPLDISFKNMRIASGR